MRGTFPKPEIRAVKASKRDNYFFFRSSRTYSKESLISGSAPWSKSINSNIRDNTLLLNMGCAHSVLTVGKFGHVAALREETNSCPISARQKELVTSTWKSIEDIKQEIGVKIYKR